MLSIMLLTTLCATAAVAQTWENYHGNAIDADGRKGVKAVAGNPGCGPAGYISVGTVDRSTANSDVYVVRMRANGTIVWSFAYDITGKGDHDEGWSIYELPNFGGFIITGHTFYNGEMKGDRTDCDVFILKIDCRGVPLTARTYGSTSRNEQGKDIIQASTGAPGDPSDPDATKPTDYIVAGWADNPIGPLGDEDGYLLRVHQTTGAIQWDATYDTNPSPGKGGYNEAFYGLIQLAPRAGQTTGDVLAVGGQNSPTFQGFVVRVDGNNGSIGNAPQGAALYGGAGPAVDFFYSPLQLKNPAEVDAGSGERNVVIVGEHNNVGGVSNIYAVKLAGGNPCQPLVEQSIGVANEHQYATDVEEITFSTAGYPTGLQQWDLVVTGAHQVSLAADPGQALLLSLAPGTLAPTPAIVGSLLSPNVARREEGWSLYPVDPALSGFTTTFGFIVAGWAYTPNAPALGPSDMYLVKTNGLGATLCSNPYSPVGATISTMQCVNPTVDLLNYMEEHTPAYKQINQRLLVCTSTPTKQAIGNDVESGDNSLLCTVAPNPVRMGEELTISLNGGANHAVSLTVTNSLGEVVRRFDSAPVDEAGQISIPTEGWAPGVYLVTLHSGRGERVSTKVLIAE